LVTTVSTLFTFAQETDSQQKTMVLKDESPTHNATSKEIKEGGFDILASLEKWSVVSTVVSLGAGIILKWLKEKSDFKKRKHTAKTILSNELSGHLTKIEEMRSPSEYVNFFFPTSAYDALIHSELFTHLTKDQQEDISEVYSTFKLHNETITHLSVLFDELQLKENFDTNRWDLMVKRHKEALIGWENKLVKENEGIRAILKEMGVEMDDKRKAVDR